VRKTKSISVVRKAVAVARKSDAKIGFVPTMGALHEGHLSLVKRAKKECGFVVVSIFVNPLQFGPNEDLEKYPRDLNRDERLLKSVGADLVFYPDVSDMYAPDRSTTVSESCVSKGLCGDARPGHFNGVTTVVAKLFNIVQPDNAYFGKKDYQQLQVISRMVRDLDIPVRVVPCAIVRESDGLAMSSRNIYLSSDDRLTAPILFRALKAAKAAVEAKKVTTAKDVVVGITKLIVGSGLSPVIDYIAVKDAVSLTDLRMLKGTMVIAIAVFFGATRLIDNIEVTVP